MSDIATKKKADRKLAMAVRSRLVDEAAPVRAAAHFIDAVKPAPGTTVSLYWPIGSELDPRGLARDFTSLSISCVLPVVVKKDQPLSFRNWQTGDPLEKSYFGVPVPLEEAGLGEPDILIVPLLAFDRLGYRLGYGGGFYDRTLETIRQKRKCIAVGFAYAGQEIDKVTIDSFDQPLDWIVTEKQARKIK